MIQNNILRHIMKLFISLMFSLLYLSSTSQNLRQILLKQDSKLKDVVVIKCKIDSTLFITILQTEINWWETLKVVKYSNYKIQSTFKFDTLPDEQSIDTAKQIALKGFSYPFIEVFAVTHQGNGFYYLYELNINKARLLVKTRAVDWNYDGAFEEYNHRYCSKIFKSGKLAPTYSDINKDGYADIKLSGIIQVVDDDNKTILKQYPGQKVFLYNKIKKQFIEDFTKRNGFKKDDD